MNPEVRCNVCRRTKDPMQHMRADHPPTAAKAWLKRTCKREGKPCEFGYRAGVDVEGLRRALKPKLTEYIVLCGQVVGGGDRPFETVYGFDGERFSEREKAISHGLKVRGSDDFNIGVLSDGKLVSLDWMGKPVDAEPSVLEAIAEQIW